MIASQLQARPSFAAPAAHARQQPRPQRSTFPKPTANPGPSSPCRALRAHKRTCIVVAAAQPSWSGGSKPSDGATSSALERARRELKELEDERDTAVATAESSTRAAMKLTDLVGLLDNMALEKVRSGDEETAKQVLQEKAASKEALEKTSAKAQVNYSLAAALAHKIGAKQNEILSLLKSSGHSSPSAGAGSQPTWPLPSAPPPPPPPPAAGRPGPDNGQYGASAARSWYANAPPSGSGQPSSSRAGAGSGAEYKAPTPKWQQSLEEAQERMRQQGTAPGAGDGVRADPRPGPSADSGPEYNFTTPKWQQSLEEARERISSANKAAETAGRAARLSAEESIAQARQRLRDQATESIYTASQRLAAQRQSSADSISKAQERLRAQDAEVLEYVRRVMARYRRGEYVSEDELEFAFQQLEKRFVM